MLVVILCSYLSHNYFTFLDIQIALSVILIITTFEYLLNDTEIRCRKTAINKTYAKALAVGVDSRDRKSFGAGERRGQER